MGAGTKTSSILETPEGRPHRHVASESRPGRRPRPRFRVRGLGRRRTRSDRHLPGRRQRRRCRRGRPQSFDHEPRDRARRSGRVQPGWLKAPLRARPGPHRRGRRRLVRHRPGRVPPPPAEPTERQRAGVGRLRGPVPAGRRTERRSRSRRSISAQPGPRRSTWSPSPAGRPSRSPRRANTPRARASRRMGSGSPSIAGSPGGCMTFS